MRKIEITDEAARIIGDIRENTEEWKALLCDAFAEAALRMGECWTYSERSASPLLALGQYSRLLDALAEENEKQP